MQIIKLIVSSFKKGDQIWFMCGSRIFRKVGGVQVHLAYKKSSDNVFFILFFLVLNLFYRSPVVTFKENYYLPRFQWGWIFSRGGGVQLFTGGGSNCFFPIETHKPVVFQVVRPPQDPPMWFRASWFNQSTRFFLFFFNITFANSFVERGGNVTSAAVLPVVVVIKY